MYSQTTSAVRPHTTTSWNVGSGPSLTATRRVETARPLLVWRSCGSHKVGLVHRWNRLVSGVASEERVNALSNAVASKTGVSVGATHALGGIVTTALFGVLKHYFTKSGGNVGQLPTLLGHQLPMVKASMTEDMSSALGLGGAGSFLSGVAAQMKAVSSHLEHPSTVGGSSSAVNPSLDRIVLEEKARSKKWWWLAVAAALALLALLGLALGALGGAALGIGAGLAWVEIFKTTSFEGYSGMLVFFTFMPVGAAIGGLGGALLFGLMAARDAAIAIEREPVRRLDP